MEQIFKYPRTRHLEGSRQQLGDADLNVVKLEEIKGSYLVLEEKVERTAGSVLAEMEKCICRAAAIF